jgi:transaldolase
MPEAPLQAVADHGQIHGDTVRGSHAAAHAVLEELSQMSMDMEEVADTLEQQGVASLAKSWDELIASVTQQLEKSEAQVMPAGAVKPASGDRGQDAAPAAAPARNAKRGASTTCSGSYRQCLSRLRLGPRATALAMSRR